MVKAGYKDTEVGVIPEDWELSKIKDVCIIINGRGFKPHEWSPNGLPIIRIQNLNGSDDFNYYSGHFDSKIFVKRSQLLFAWSGSRGTSFGPHIWNGVNALLNYHTWKLSVDDSKIDSKYFYHALKILTKHIEEQAHGASALVHTQKGEMEEFVFRRPKKEEQQAIAKALSDVDALITFLDKLIAKKCAIKTAVMQQLLTGKTRLPGFDEKWHSVSVAKHMTLNARIGWQGLKTDEYLENGQYSLVTGTDFNNGHINWGTCHFVDEWRYTQDKKIQLKNGDVLLTKDGTIGKVGYVEYVHKPATLNSGVFVIRPIGNTIDSLFLYYVLTSRIFDNFLSKLSAGSTIAHLYQKDFVTFNFIVPETVEQKAIALILSDMDAEITALENRRNKTNSIKQGMMQELLSERTRLV